jgi:hypothetical protein
VLQSTDEDQRAWLALSGDVWWVCGASRRKYGQIVWSEYSRGTLVLVLLDSGGRVGNQEAICSSALGDFPLQIPPLRWERRQIESYSASRSTNYCSLVEGAAGNARPRMPHDSN